ncbi:SAM hydrolase/SAM-dependent halogenase family protein [Halofilum ochraceum]|uniref:SAM hydrolase/SAM-dependent halogenase family protein n=1 Tax=Halofilum ochraceum TaxID=1611323 RepID=UPI00083791BF|nr:SAM-dependent chlorinase/fluorinase [Halofilum ochraceum]
MIALFTDFGWSGPYVGQMHAVLARAGVTDPVIDLMHDAPAFDPLASAHLLAALVPSMPAGTVFVGVIDPGVGTARAPVVVEADGQWFVGPDNGLFDVVSARATDTRRWRITRAPERQSVTFHGRDLFAPVAAEIAQGGSVPGRALPLTEYPDDTAADREAIIYIDAFGNAVTGLRPPRNRIVPVLNVAGRCLSHRRTFADAAPGEALWLVNSMDLVEIAVNRGSAAEMFGLSVGSRVTWGVN